MKGERFIYVMKLVCAVLDGVVSYMASIFAVMGLYMLAIVQRNNGTVVDLTGELGEKMLFINVNVLASTFFAMMFGFAVICFFIDRRGKSIVDVIVYYSTVLFLCFIAKKVGAVVDNPLQMMKFEIVCALGCVCVFLRMILKSMISRLTVIKYCTSEPCGRAVKVD